MVVVVEEPALPVNLASIHHLRGNALQDRHDRVVEGGIADGADPGDVGCHYARKLRFGGHVMDIDVAQIEVHLRFPRCTLSTREASLVLVPDVVDDVLVEAAISVDATLGRDVSPGACWRLQSMILVAIRASRVVGGGHRL